MVSAPSAFDTLRPLCVHLARHPDNESVTALSSALQSINNEDLQKLQEYLLFPLRLLLKQAAPGSHDLRISAIVCVEHILRDCTTYRLETFQDLFNTLCLVLSSPANQGKVAAGFEELKLAVVTCLSTLLKRSDVSILVSFYTTTCLPLIGHAVSLLLNLAENEKMRELRVNAMLCLKDLALCDRKGIAPLTPTHIGGLFASFLPGIAISLGHVITADSKQGQKVTTCALTTWTSLVTLVLGDVHLGLSGDDIQRPPSHQIQDTASTSTQHADASHRDSSHDTLVVNRTREWQKETTTNLALLVTRISSLVSHTNWRIRMALVSWADDLLVNCTRSLESCLSHFLEALVTLLSDDYTAVSSHARDALCRGSKGMADSPLRPVLETSLYHLSEQLPRLVRNADDSKKLATLRLTSGYIRLLGSSVNSLISSYSHLQRLSLALLQSLQFDCSHILMLQEQIPCEPLVTSFNNEYLHKSFKHFRDDAVLAEATTICRLLGYYGDLHILVDHFMDQCHQSSLYRKQAILIITEILKGTTAKDLRIEGVSDSYQSDVSTIELIISDLLEDFLSASNWTLSTSNMSGISQSQTDRSLTRFSGASWTAITESRDLVSSAVSVERLNGEVLQTCLILEAVGSFAQILGEKFRWHLMSALYPVLEKLGDTNGCISHTAHTSLTHIAIACRYDDVCDLLAANSDYLLNDISLRLRHSDQQVKAMSVLKVILMYGGKQAICLVDDIIHDILLALDIHYEDEAMQFVTVLSTLVSAILKWHQPQQQQDHQKDSAASADKFPTTSDKMLAFFVDYQKHQNTAAGLFTEDDAEEMLDHDDGGDDGREDGQVAADDDKKEPPKYIKLVMQVMERCRHLLATSSCTLQILVLDAIGQSCMVLQHYEEQLLPLVHKVWPAFLNRFVSADRRVTTKAFDVLLMMASVCGNFIRQRVVKCIFPEIATFLQKEAEISLRSSGPMSRHNVNNKLQRHLLAGIGDLCKKMDVDWKDVDLMLKSSLPYLSARQPSHLQQACLESYAVFLDLQPDLVWLRMRSIYNPDPPCRPHPSLADIQLTGSQTTNEFSDNFTVVLQKIDVPEV